MLIPTKRLVAKNPSHVSHDLISKYGWKQLSHVNRFSRPATIMHYVHPSHDGKSDRPLVSYDTGRDKFHVYTMHGKRTKLVEKDIEHVPAAVSWLAKNGSKHWPDIYNKTEKKS